MVMTCRSALFASAAVWIASFGNALAQDSRPTDSAPAESRHSGKSVLKESLWTSWKIDDVERQAWIHLPSRKKGGLAPVVFAFHGHGGSARGAAEMFRFQDEWPEALVVYMEGLPTPGRLSDP